VNERHTVIALLRRAEERTGLSDWGDDGFRRGLDVLVESLERDACLHIGGRAVVFEMVLRALEQRLQFVAVLGRQPEPAGEHLLGPLVIASPPRTGSTYLQRLLALADGALSLPLWLSLAPLPPPPGDWRGPQPARIGAQRQRLDSYLRLMRGLQHKHELGPELPEEDDHLFLCAFRSRLWWTLAPVRGYAEWLDREPPAAAYGQFGALLRLLQRRTDGEHWILKSPGHFFDLDGLLDAFPEATVVVLHRNPREVLASWHGIIETLHGAVAASPDRAQMVAYNTASLAAAAERLVEIDRGQAGARLHHVAYGDLVSDPVGTVRGIHERAGLPWSGAFGERLERHVAPSPRRRHGGSAPTLSRFGQADLDVERLFLVYLERFGSFCRRAP
jgi:hypothetical protein